ncbi:het domain-containing protein [Colletotrichum incanum]|uniref:Het domain-containing protein n=1 Tax=Colletotrichum incanum TaxID=1573173 RepID=A0A162NHI8_COLIC|nr:het domain-containing protein [Colletotrichum incanum]
MRIKLPVIAAINCLCAMLSVISTEDADPEQKRMMCPSLMEENHIHRRCPFPGRRFPIHRLVVCGVKEIYLLSKVPQNTPSVMPLPYRHFFEYGFYINLIDESFSTNINHQMVTSVDCLVPQYMQTLTVGFRSALTHSFGGLILRINHLNERFLVFLSVSRRKGVLKWNCEVLDGRYVGHDVEAWRQEFKSQMDDEGVEPDCNFHTAVGSKGNS